MGTAMQARGGATSDDERGNVSKASVGSRSRNVRVGRGDGDELDLKLSRLSEDETSVDAATRTWLATVTSGRISAAEETAALYAEDAVLWGTVSEDLRRTPDDIKAYFRFFAHLPGLTVVPGSYRAAIQCYGETAISSGYYDFDVPDRNGERRVIKGRFTFCYRRVKGAWIIVNHHSSQVRQSCPARRVSTK